ncbi:hypothetical protein ASG20_10895 [Sphingomonas sp. Leaf198]|nr:hypothetical protein ASG20_10895 [Sphingomonas sp. Leaf198]
MNQHQYSHLISCLHDQDAPVGAIGRGAHHSIFRSVQWHTLSGEESKRGRLHDFAVIWDEDHDERIIGVIERLHLAGLLWPVVFIGERKGNMTVLLAHGAGPIELDEPGYVEAVGAIVQDVDHDVWDVRFGTFHRDPANDGRLTNAAGIIADDEPVVVAYLQSIDILWQLGERGRTTFPGLAA